MRELYKGLRLKRTFTMELNGEMVRFWRVIAPETCPNYQSDLSVEGLKDWGLIR